ncbi:GNAT family N-acetyltransferase [Aquamicrobium lusatiense]|uniref:GNAT family N-acetyltransferase n=1 Tax=Aquamicrobium lusatiense TaxID=89772 RepID=UPI00245586DD|nr:GNAT family N-acetyltransferase [Aquamicrobium lusatiense]MDH4990853.1 GNAT family N-acetyltransferase [Aquamicrobium lusatiense]
MIRNTVRHATPEDRLAIIRLLKESHGAAGFTFPFSAPHADMLFRRHMECGLVLVCGKPAHGVLMAATFDHPFGAGKWAKETVWYIAPSSRGRSALRMLDAYEAWAREQGCTTIGMASLASNDVSKIYERRGYAPAETHFVKAL